MQQNEELARVKARIRALADKTVSNGCTEAEALAAAEMVGRLLDRYSLTMAEVDLRQTPCVELAVYSGAARRRPIDGCIPAIARFCDCKVWLARGDDEAAAQAPSAGVSYVFFGFEPDAVLARYLFQVVDAAMATASRSFREQNPKLRDVALRRAATSFQHGMAARVAERLDAMQSNRATAVAAQRSGGRALALVKHAVVDAAFRDTGTRLAAARRPTRQIVGSAFRDGRKAGEQVNLDRPLTGAAPSRLE